MPPTSKHFASVQSRRIRAHPRSSTGKRRKDQPAPAPLLQAYFTNITRNGDSDRPTLSQRMFEQMRRRILINAAEKAAGADAKRPGSHDYAPAQAYSTVARTGPRD